MGRWERPGEKQGGWTQEAVDTRATPRKRGGGGLPGAAGSGRGRPEVSASPGGRAHGVRGSHRGDRQQSVGLRFGFGGPLSSFRFLKRRPQDFDTRLLHADVTILYLLSSK